MRIRIDNKTQAEQDVSFEEYFIDGKLSGRAIYEGEFNFCKKACKMLECILADTSMLEDKIGLITNIFFFYMRERRHYNARIDGLLQAANCSWLKISQLCITLLQHGLSVETLQEKAATVIIQQLIDKRYIQLLDDVDATNAIIIQSLDIMIQHDNSELACFVCLCASKNKDYQSRLELLLKQHVKASAVYLENYTHLIFSLLQTESGQQFIRNALHAASRAVNYETNVLACFPQYYQEAFRRFNTRYPTDYMDLLGNVYYSLYIEGIDALLSDQSVQKGAYPLMTFLLMIGRSGAEYGNFLQVQQHLMRHYHNAIRLEKKNTALLALYAVRKLTSYVMEDRDKKPVNPLAMVDATASIDILSAMQGQKQPEIYDSALSQWCFDVLAELPNPDDFYSQSFLEYLCLVENPDVVEAILLLFPDIAQMHWFGYKKMLTCSQNTEVNRLLMQHGVRLELADPSPLAAAVEAGNDELLHVFLDGFCEANQDQQALVRALSQFFMRGDVQSVEQICSYMTIDFTQNHLLIEGILNEITTNQWFTFQWILRNIMHESTTMHWIHDGCYDERGRLNQIGCHLIEILHSEAETYRPMTECIGISMLRRLIANYERGCNVLYEIEMAADIVRSAFGSESFEKEVAPLLKIATQMLAGYANSPIEVPELECWERYSKLSDIFGLCFSLGMEGYYFKCAEQFLSNSFNPDPIVKNISCTLLQEKVRVGLQALINAKDAYERVRVYMMLSAWIDCLSNATLRAPLLRFMSRAIVLEPLFLEQIPNEFAVAYGKNNQYYINRLVAIEYRLEKLSPGMGLFDSVQVRQQVVSCRERLLSDMLSDGQVSEGTITSFKQLLQDSQIKDAEFYQLLTEIVAGYTNTLHTPSSARSSS